MAEPIWNVRVTVIDLVPAATAEEAVAKLAARVQKVGVDIYQDTGKESDAFESEPLSGDVEASVRANWNRPYYVSRDNPPRQWSS